MKPMNRMPHDVVSFDVEQFLRSYAGELSLTPTGLAFLGLIPDTHGQFLPQRKHEMPDAPRAAAS